MAIHPHPAPVFMSTEPRPVQVDAELNLEPLYFNFGEEKPITFLALNDGIHQVYAACNGVQDLIKNLPDDIDIEPQRLMIDLALKYMISTLDDLCPGDPKSKRGYKYDYSTTPPSLQSDEIYFAKARAEQKAHQEKLHQNKEEVNHA